MQTVVSKHVDLDLARVQSVFGDLEGQAQAALDGEGFGRDEQRMQRTADLRYVGQAFEVRVPVADGELDRAAAEDVAQAFHAAHRQLYGYDFATDPRQAVEWVNLRVSGIGPIRRPDIVELPAKDGGTDRAVTGSRRVFFDDWIDTPTYNRLDLAPGRRRHRPRDHRGVRLDRPGAPRLRRHRRRLRQPAAHEGVGQ